MVSQDVELPTSTVGFTNESRSILKKNGKRSPRAHLDFKCTKTADRFNKVQEQSEPSLGVIQDNVKTIEIPTLRPRGLVIWAPRSTLLGGSTRVLVGRRIEGSHILLDGGQHC